MRFSLVICTYMRSEPLVKLLKSVSEQTLYPNEILIIDGSTNNQTQSELERKNFKNLNYYKVDSENRGLTKQRNYGIDRVGKSIEIICFLDDDIILDNIYFENLIGSYNHYPNALAVGGYITNAAKWELESSKTIKGKFKFNGWQRDEPLRYKLRRFFGLLPDCPPGFLPKFSHGRPISFLPPKTGIYETELFMGGVSSYRKSSFQHIKFSDYFVGYGLYEDAEFCLRLSKLGKLYVNTDATCQHYHHQSGRPNMYTYGKMVVRNGWYIWRTKNENPNFSSKLKWHAITILLTKVKFLNVITTSKRKQAFNEGIGRVVGWWSILFNPPKLKG